MKMKSILLALALGLAATAWAYEPLTHREITRAAAQVSAIAGDENLDRVGLNRSGFTPSDPEWVVAWLRFGAHAEDVPKIRSLNHFFDPVNDSGLFGFFSKSPDWALGETVITNNYSYRKAKVHLREAILATDPADYIQGLALMYRSLGQVVHHTQDMSQPEHVRNDQHHEFLDKSLYELFSLEQHTGIDLDPDAGNRFNENLNKPYGGSDGASVILANPREFWTTAGRQGIADFTNRNFVSKDTNFRLENGLPAANAEYNSPEPTILPSEVVTLAELMPERGAMLCGFLGSDPHVVFPPGTTCNVEFYGTDVVDEYLGGTSEFNRRASSLSVFDQYLSRFNINVIHIGTFGLSQPLIFVDRVFTLNRFNYAAAHPFLLHRAAAYSAGLLNHFFRGRLEISLPGEGAFAVADHATDGGFPAFRRIKATLRNATPALETPNGTIAQEMSGGEVRAVVRYWTNPCYEPDLSGELNADLEIPSGCTLDTYVSGTEGIAVSAPQPIGALQSATGVTFEFGDSPIPVNIRDALLQVVYTGDLGTETDAVVVGMLNVSEPTYLTVFNNSDYFALDGAFHTPDEIRGNPDLLTKVDFNGDGVEDINLEPVAISGVRYGAGGGFWTEPVTIQPRAITRIVALFDSALPISLQIPHIFPGQPLLTHSASVQPLTTQLMRDPASVSVMTETRGFYRWFMLYLFKRFGAAPPLEAVDDLPDIDPPPQPTEVTVIYLQ